jgi:hypothetical protein
MLSLHGIVDGLKMINPELNIGRRGTLTYADKGEELEFSSFIGVLK